MIGAGRVALYFFTQLFELYDLEMKYECRGRGLVPFSLLRWVFAGVWLMRPSEFLLSERLGWFGYDHIWMPWVELSHTGCFGRMPSEILHVGVWEEGEKGNWCDQWTYF